MDLNNNYKIFISFNFQQNLILTCNIIKRITYNHFIRFTIIG
jgi:hypothetical protein